MTSTQAYSLGNLCEKAPEEPSFFSVKVRSENENPHTASSNHVGDTSEVLRTQSEHNFDKTASIVFIGPRGNGKSTLAVIAGLVLKRRVIDAEDYFITTTGVSKSEFKRKHGNQKYRYQELDSIRSLLERYDQNHVIACGPSITADQFRTFMIEYKRTHPVVYVTRSVEEIENYLGIDNGGEIHQWVKTVHPIYRRISNLEYFNIPENGKEDRPSVAEEFLQSVLPCRDIRQKKVNALQKTQTAVVRFLVPAVGHISPPLLDSTFPTIYPNLPEQRRYSSALSVTVSSILHGDFDIIDISAGADVIELVIDNLDRQTDTSQASATIGRFVAEIRRFLAIPIIYHVEIGNNEDGDWEYYFELLYQGLRFAPDYLTVDVKAPAKAIQRLVDCRRSTQIMAHGRINTDGADYWQSSEPLKLYEKAVALGCGLVRLFKNCNAMSDNFECMSFVKKINNISASVPVIAVNVGDTGRLSVACNPLLTPVTFSTNVLETPRPTDISMKQMTVPERYNILFTLRALVPLQFYVVGTTVKNSLSPAMHNTGFHHLGMPHRYTIHESKSIEDLRILFKTTDFGGASISLPFKTEIMSLVERLSPSAELLGASNTILPIRKQVPTQSMSDARCKSQRHQAGPVTMLYGENTDWMGICACASRSISPANSINSQTTALVIGAGGMARAAIYCLLYLGVRNISIFNRTFAHAKSVATYFQEAFPRFLSNNNHYSLQLRADESKSLTIKVLESVDAMWPSEFCQPSIVICAIKAYDREKSYTPAFKLPTHWMKSPTGGVVIELAYHSSETPLMQQMREESPLGWAVVDPIEVLYEQACAQFELFTGNKAPRKAMWEACLEDYAAQMQSGTYDRVSK